MNPRFLVPVNAILFSGGFTVIISLINLGSSDAFNAILSLAAVAQMATYLVSISCILYRRLTAPHLLPKAQWSLGKYGVLINSISVAYAGFVWFWMFWPTTASVNATSMNYAVVMFFGVLAIAAAFFVVKARKTYFGPVTKTTGWRDE